MHFSRLRAGTWAGLAAGSPAQGRYTEAVSYCLDGRQSTPMALCHCTEKWHQHWKKLAQRASGCTMRHLQCSPPGTCLCFQRKVALQQLEISCQRAFWNIIFIESTHCWYILSKVGFDLCKKRIISTLPCYFHLACCSACLASSL